MSAFYDPTSTTSLISYARNRFRDVGGLSGTTVTKPLLLDEEYQMFVTRCGDREGLAQAAEALAATFAQKVKEYSESGGIDVIWPDRPKFYLDLAASIRTYGIDMSNGGVRAWAPVTPTPCNDRRLVLEPGCCEVF